MFITNSNINKPIIAPLSLKTINQLGYTVIVDENGKLLFPSSLDFCENNSIAKLNASGKLPLSVMPYKQGSGIIIDEDGTISSTGGGGSGGTNDYTQLVNKPKINNVTLVGNLSLADLNIPDQSKLDEKQDKLIAGENITIIGNTISATNSSTTSLTSITEIEGTEGYLKFPDNTDILSLDENTISDIKITLYASSNNNLEKYTISFVALNKSEGINFSSVNCVSNTKINESLISKVDVQQVGETNQIQILITLNQSSKIFSYFSINQTNL